MMYDYDREKGEGMINCDVQSVPQNPTHFVIWLSWITIRPFISMLMYWETSMDCKNRNGWRDVILITRQTVFCFFLLFKPSHAYPLIKYIPITYLITKDFFKDLMLKRNFFGNFSKISLFYDLNYLWLF